MPLPLRLQSNSFATKLSAQVALGAFRKVISDMALSSLNIIVTEVPTPNSSNPLSETYRGVITKQLGVVTSYVSNVHSISGEGCVDDDEKASILFQKATFLYDLSQYSNVLRKILLNGYCSRSYLEREIARWSNSLSMSSGSRSPKNAWNSKNSFPTEIVEMIIEAAWLNTAATTETSSDERWAFVATARAVNCQWRVMVDRVCLKHIFIYDSYDQRMYSHLIDDFGLRRGWDGRCSDLSRLIRRSTLHLMNVPVVKPAIIRVLPYLTRVDVQLGESEESDDMINCLNQLACWCVNIQALRLWGDPCMAFRDPKLPLADGAFSTVRRLQLFSDMPPAFCRRLGQIFPGLRDLRLSCRIPLSSFSFPPSFRSLVIDCIPICHSTGQIPNTVMGYRLDGAVLPSGIHVEVYGGDDLPFFWKQVSNRCADHNILLKHRSAYSNSHPWPFKKLGLSPFWDLPFAAVEME